MPPPPPPPPGPPPPPLGLGLGPPAKSVSSGGGASERNALLKSIQQGKALKKTVTNDRSAPAVVNPKPKPPESGSNGSGLGSGSGPASIGSSTQPRLPGIGGLFAEGIPRLKPTSGGIQTGRTAAAGFPSSNGAGRGGHGPTSLGKTGKNFSSSLEQGDGMQRQQQIAKNHTNQPSSLNSTPSLTPSASPSIGGIRKPGAPPPPGSGLKPSAPPPPPPPASNAKPQMSNKPIHPGSKPPPPPAPTSAPPARPPVRTQSFNQGQRSATFDHRSSRDDTQMLQLGVRNGDGDDYQGPLPPVRTVSILQTNTVDRRRQGPAPVPTQPVGGSARPTRPPPMKPPNQPPPPPPVGQPPPPPHRAHPAPPPFTTMQPTQVRAVQILESNVSNPPTPPTRRHSLRQNGSGYAHSNSSSTSSGDSFEARFSHLFKAVNFLPPPEPFTNCPKTYPSKNQHQILAGRQGSMAKRAPAPPPPPQKGAPPPPAAPPLWTGSTPLRT